MKPSDITDSEGNPLTDVRLPDLDWDLLVQAFDGRPIRATKAYGYPNADIVLLLVCHEYTDLHIDIRLTAADLDLLKADFNGFKQRIVEPMINNLDGAAYPERFERYIAAVRRTAAALANGNANAERPAAS